MPGPLSENTISIVLTEASGRHGYGDFIGGRVADSVFQKVFKYLFHSAWIDLGRSRLGTPLHRHTRHDAPRSPA